MTLLKTSLLTTFGVWFLLGAGLFLSGFFCVEIILEFKADTESEKVFFYMGLFAIGGGVFVGLLALAIRRLVDSFTPSGAILRDEGPTE